MTTDKRTRRMHSTALGAAVLLAATLILLTPACGGGSDDGPDTSAGGVETTAGPSAEIPLRYIYTEGDSWIHEATSDDQVTMDAALTGGSEGTVTTHETAKERRTATVEQANADGTATLVMFYEQVESAVDGAAQDLSSEVPEESTVTIDATGRVTSVEGFDGDAATSGTFDSAGFSQLFDYLDASYDSTAVHYPEDGTAEVGETWSSTYVIPLPGMGKELEVTTEATLVSVSHEEGRQIAVIEHTSDMPIEVTFDLSDYFRSLLEGTSYVDDLQTLVVKMTMKGDIGYSATSRVDTATGQLVTAEGQATMLVEFTYTEAPETLFPADQRGPFTMDARGKRTIVAVE